MKKRHGMIFALIKSHTADCTHSDILTIYMSQFIHLHSVYFHSLNVLHKHAWSSIDLPRCVCEYLFLHSFHPEKSAPLPAHADGGPERSHVSSLSLPLLSFSWRFIKHSLTSNKKHLPLPISSSPCLSVGRHRALLYRNILFRGCH